MSETLTPMMRQYHSLRKDLPADTFLLFRLGDFYEMFFEDAKEASALLNVALTRRGEVPMCGVPYHAAKGYIVKLIAAGKRVALCEQVGEVEPGKLVRREVTQILSAGTLSELGLEEDKNNFLAALRHLQGSYGFACVDLSTGEFRLTQFSSRTQLLDELVRVSPAEVIAPSSQEDHFKEHFKNISLITGVEPTTFDTEVAASFLQEHFKISSLDGLGCTELPVAVGAAGALLHFLTRELRRDGTHLRRPKPYYFTETVQLDTATQSHLELVQARSGRTMTLLGATDRTVTPMGARLLREWILHPLCEVEKIRSRQDAVSVLVEDPLRLGELRKFLSEVRDMERCVSRLSQNTGNARDLAALGISLMQLPKIVKETLHFVAACDQQVPPLLAQLATSLHPLPELCAALSSAIVETPPALLREGGLIREGVNSSLDELRTASRDGKTWITQLQEREAARTGIKSLKVRYNSIFGYFIEITKSHLSSVPADYTRKQTTANGERYITQELKLMEGRILQADERAQALEFQIFQDLRERALRELPQIQESAASLATLDVLAAFAETARLYQYCRPQMDHSKVLFIEQGRHPVLDQRIGEGTFVPNDTLLDETSCRFVIITGPNMAGKSTYIRQVALLVLLAQTGSFLPAKSAHVGVVDKIFTRVGASDDLSRGQSTFMVEMNETANILNNATEKSLVILDEIGRGTSTFDGLSIAWSVAEHLHDCICARTLFATHYHELTDLERTRSGVKNFNVSVREWNDEVIFLRKIVPGRADQSYGIQVARLAGLPETVLLRAKEILTNLEKLELNAEGKPSLAAGTRRRAAAAAAESQLTFL